MIVVLAGVMLLVVGVTVIVAATGLAGTRTDGTRLGGIGLAAPILGVGAAVVVLLLAAVVGLGGLRSTVGGSDADLPRHRSAEPEPEPEREPGEPVPVVGPLAAFDGHVSISVDGSGVRAMRPVGDVQAGDVLYVSGEGFLDHAEGVVAQCEQATAPRCRNVLPILTDGAGRLRVPYRIDGPASGDVLVVEVDLVRGAARLVFGAPALAPALSVSAGGDVIVERAPAGSVVSLVRCPAGAADLDACELADRLAVAADGRATGRVGFARESMVTLVDADGVVLVDPVPLVAALRPDVEVALAPAQLLGGFGLAIVLLAVGIALIRTTDWRVPAEAATPALDAAPQ